MRTRFFLVWEEVFDNGDQIKDNTIVEAWKNWGAGWRQMLERVTLSPNYKTKCK